MTTETWAPGIPLHDRTASPARLIFGFRSCADDLAECRPCPDAARWPEPYERDDLELRAVWVWPDEVSA